MGNISGYMPEEGDGPSLACPNPKCKQYLDMEYGKSWYDHIYDGSLEVPQKQFSYCECGYQFATSRKCPKCKKESSIKIKFCPDCGASLANGKPYNFWERKLPLKVESKRKLGWEPYNSKIDDYIETSG